MASDSEFILEHGGIVEIGPECFAVADGAVVCWRGVNYVRQPDPDAPLDGATEPGAESAQSATPGEFAARWNAATEEQRTGWLRAMQMESERAVLCKLRHEPRQHGTIDQLVRDAEAGDV